MSGFDVHEDAYYGCCDDERYDEYYPAWLSRDERNRWHSLDAAYDNQRDQDFPADEYFVAPDMSGLPV